jgi:hypothetical protein
LRNRAQKLKNQKKQKKEKPIHRNPDLDTFFDHEKNLPQIDEAKISDEDNLLNNGSSGNTTLSSGHGNSIDQN